MQLQLEKVTIILLSEENFCTLVRAKVIFRVLSCPPSKKVIIGR